MIEPLNTGATLYVYIVCLKEVTEGISLIVITDFSEQQRTGQPNICAGVYMHVDTHIKKARRKYPKILAVVFRVGIL